MAKKQAPEVFMPELPPVDRLEFMRNNCEKQEKRRYFRPLTPGEVRQRQNEFFRNHDVLAEIETDLKEIKKSFKDRTDPIKLENNRLRIEVNTKQREVDGEIFHMADWDTSEIITYDSTGEEVGRRRMYPDEKQKRASFPLRKVSNGESEPGSPVDTDEEDDDD